MKAPPVLQWGWFGLVSVAISFYYVVGYRYGWPTLVGWGERSTSVGVQVLDAILVWMLIWLLLLGIFSLNKSNRPVRHLSIVVCATPGLVGVLTSALLFGRDYAGLRQEFSTHDWFRWLHVLVCAGPAGGGFTAWATLWRCGRLMLRANTRFPSNCCERCGYDLTGNVSGICSECGTPISEILRTSLKQRDDLPS
jgi:hypothetical protein